jgi:hypothetical protein
MGYANNGGIKNGSSYYGYLLPLVQAYGGPLFFTQYSAFDATVGWWANSTLAIDQGPIICMIENYRTGLLWNLFMSAPEVQNGLTKPGFTY